MASLRFAFPLAGWLLLLAAPAGGYEPDVHDGLTQWLARKAGFELRQASAIALGNVRVDSGLIDTMELVLEHACVGVFPETAAEVQARHYPSARTVPARAEERPVVPGSAPARKPLADLQPQLAGKEELMLGRFGAALHTLQDSWSHAGKPGVPAPGAGIVCDASYASGPASARAAHPHAAALTMSHPGDVVAMAAATYEALVAYPAVAGAKRQAKPWATLAPLVDRFARARTKTEKREWFVGQGIENTGFLRDVTLPDGPHPGDLKFEGRLLPALKTATSTQHDAAPDVKAFFDGWFARWLGAEPVEVVVAALAVKSGGAPTSPTIAARQRELAARLKLWKLRDHGTAAVLAHAPAPLNASQLKALDTLARAPGAYVQVDDLRQAFFPLLPKSPHPPPLMPYIVRELPPAGGAQPRAIAITRLRHAPYDTLGFIAERGPEGWALADFVFVVDQ